jgi:ATP adenylyltransferase
MTYILGEREDRCIFCAAGADSPDEENLVLSRASKCLVMMNRFPYNNGHIMLAPLRHVGTLEELEDEEGLELMQMIRLSIKILRAELNPEGFNVGCNLGRTAGAGIADHVHLHIVPRWNGDTNFMPVLSETKVINEALDQTYEKLRRRFAASDHGAL